MGKVSTGATMSLDGYIAGPGDSGFDLLFQWYGNGDVHVPTINPELSFDVSRPSAVHLAAWNGSLGALVVGRHLYDFTNAWGGRHPLDVTTVVLTHRPLPSDENFVFVTEGIEAAVARAKEIAGDRDVGLNSGRIARQALDAGLVDEVHIDLVPVLLGEGTPYFPELGVKPVQLEGPIRLVEGKEVTHLTYAVRK